MMPDVGMLVVIVKEQSAEPEMRLLQPVVLLEQM
jgi:hypothetical protein